MESEGTSLDTFACLYIIRGEPFQPGTCLNLGSEVTIIGRSSKVYSPDIAFTNSFISSKHAWIRYDGEKAVLFDFGSRNGTNINGVRALPHTDYTLATGDRIELAKGLVVIHFTYLFGEHTLELEPIVIAEDGNGSLDKTTIYREKRICEVGGKRIPMSEKEFILVSLLHGNADRMVPIQDIKRTVWSDRSMVANGTPDVTMDELNALIYRIRKKYGRDAFSIKSVRGSGYMLERGEEVDFV